VSTFSRPLVPLVFLPSLSPLGFSPGFLVACGLHIIRNVKKLGLHVPIKIIKHLEICLNIDIFDVTTIILAYFSEYYIKHSAYVVVIIFYPAVNQFK
jgi:hypothetical protein